MINRLTLRNFQVHERLSLEFSPGVNTISGDTDSGKSSIIRALRLVAQNKPSGESYVRHGAKKAFVAIELDGVRIKRERGAENTYSIKKGEQTNVFRSFGNTVPDPVQDILRLSPINFQNQHDPPFWLSSSAAEVSRQLNAVVDLDEIDRVLGKAAAKLREAKTTLSIQEKRLSDSLETYKNLKHVPDLNRMLERAEALEEKKSKMDNNIVSLLEIIDQINRQKEKKEGATVRYEVSTEALQIAGDYIKVLKRKEELRGILIEIDKNASISMPPSTDHLKALLSLWTDSSQNHNKLEAQIEKIEAQNRKVERAEKCKTLAKEKLLLEMKGKCPICGNRLQ